MSRKRQESRAHIATLRAFAPLTRRPALLLGLFAVIPHIPMLTVTGLFADDWTWAYLVRFEGPGALLRALFEAAHPLYGPWITGFLLLGEIGPSLSRAAAVALHGINGYLLFRVLRRPRLTRRVALLAAVLFVVSPLYTARGMMSHTPYDLFLAAWLVSVILMHDRRLWRRRLAPVAMALAMGVEPMVMLEPLRLLYLWRPGMSVAMLLRHVWVVWAVGLGVLALRLTAYSPSGHYEGYRTFNRDPVSLGRLLLRSLNHIPESFTVAAQNAWLLLSSWELAVLLLLAAALFWRLAAPRRIGRRELVIVPFGIALFLLAALPYALLGEHLSPYRFESRFAFVPQIGAAIALAGLIAAVPFSQLRRLAAFAILFVSALSVAGDGKWLRLDEALQRDLASQLAARLRREPEPVIVRLALEPMSHQVLFRHRCLGANDLNMPLAIRGANHGFRSFVYETECGDAAENRQYCTLSYLDKRPCPSRVIEARYVIDESRSRIEAATLWDALGLTDKHAGGRLVLEDLSLP